MSDQVTPRRDWMARGACRGVDVSLFISDRSEEVRRAKRVCAGCEVKEACAAFALADPTIDGIWGGTTAKERWRMRRAASR